MGYLKSKHKDEHSLAEKGQSKEKRKENIGKEVNKISLFLYFV